MAKAYFDLKKQNVDKNTKCIFSRRINQHANNAPQNNNIQQKDKDAEEFLRSNMGKENRIISSMKCVLYLLYKLDKISFMKAQFDSVFNNCQNYQPTIMFSFNQIINIITGFEKGQINKAYYDRIISDFIKYIFINRQ